MRYFVEVDNGQIKIIGPAGTPVDTITDGSTERFAVDADVSSLPNSIGVNSLTADSRWYHEDSIALTQDAWVTAFDSDVTSGFASTGRVHNIVVVTNTQGVEFRLTIDGTDIAPGISADELNDGGMVSTNFFIGAEVYVLDRSAAAHKVVFDFNGKDLYYASSAKLEVKQTTAGLKEISHLQVWHTRLT